MFFWGNTTFISLPFLTISLLLIFGLTHTQSISLGKGSVPFVSTATLNPWLLIFFIRLLSNCNIGSPPVKTTNLFFFSFRP